MESSMRSPAPQADDVVAQAHRISWAEGAHFTCGGQDTLLAGALRSGLGLPYECNAGGCGSCKVTLLEGEVMDLQPTAPGIKPRERERGKVLACQCIPKGSCKISFKEDPECVPAIQPVRMAATFMGSRAITHDLREFTFKVNSPADFLPGQYAILGLPGLAERRSYSMSNLANREGIFQFIIRRVPNGKATGILYEELKIGSECTIDGPYSSAYLREDSPRDIVCIAGGSGLAPMVSVVKGALQSADLAGVKVHLFYGGREPRDIFPLNLLELIADSARVEFVPAISCDDSLAGDWSGERGFIHHCVERRLASQFQGSEFYLAGPPPMVDAVRRMLLLDHAVPAERLHYDRFF